MITHYIFYSDGDNLWSKENSCELLNWGVRFCIISGFDDGFTNKR